MLARIVTRYSHFKMCALENVCEGHDLQHLQPLDGKYLPSRLMAIAMFALSLTVFEYCFKYLTLKSSVKVTEYNIRSENIRWQIPTCLKSTRVFTLARTVSDILMFEIFYLANIGQGHVVQLCNGAV